MTVTNSPDPVLRGEWLRDGVLVCAVGANRPGARELDGVVLERAAFICCDSREQALLESADLIEPVGRGLLDWRHVHELQEVVAGEVRGRESDTDVVLFKSNGLAAWDVAIGAAALERARELGVGRELLDLDRVARVGDRVVADRLDHLGPVEQPGDLVGREAVLDVAVLENLCEIAPAVVLADHVGGDSLLSR